MSHHENKRILVAGASGVIGRRLCRLLLEDGWEVTGTTRSSDKASALRSIGVVPAIVDVFDETALRHVVMEAQPLLLSISLLIFLPARSGQDG